MPQLSQADLDLLRHLVGRMIPAAPAYDAPGADNPAIFQEIAAALQDKAPVLQGLLSDLAAGALDAAAPAEIAAQALGLRKSHGAAFAVVVSAVAQCYYRDDRVMRALGMEARPPFPKGYEVSQGDWTLLDAVRGRPPIWRGAD
jgi:hypothetical protein